VLAVARRHSTRPLLGGVLAGIGLICVYALLSRLLPERLGTYDPLATYRLNTPIGYWNGLGLFAVMGALLAVGFATRGKLLATRIVAAASIVVLLPTLYFTFSRGSWIALGVGLAAAVAADPRRLELTTAIAAFGALPAAAIVLASRSPALTHQHEPLAQATHDGHRLLLWIVVLAAGQALVAVGYRELQRRVAVAPPVRLAYAALLLAALAASLGLFFAHYGTPSHVVRRAYHSFTAPPPKNTGDLNSRLFNLSGNGRWPLWQVAVREVRAHPLLGGGAGSFAAYWAQHRPAPVEVQDAHNLYLETLAEIGPVGLALLVAALAIPAVAAVRLRRHPLVPPAFGAYAAFLAAAIVDWDWELAGVTLTALFIGLACVLAARDREREARSLSPSTRFGMAAVLVALSGFVVVALLGNAAAGVAAAAARDGNFESAERHARTAIRWAPWSAVGWKELGEAQLSSGLDARYALRKAIAKDPSDWVLWLDLASAERGAARRAALAHARELNPLSPEIRDFAEGL
jgi:hypothetical protein